MALRRRSATLCVLLALLVAGALAQAPDSDYGVDNESGSGEDFTPAPTDQYNQIIEYGEEYIATPGQADFDYETEAEAPTEGYYDYAEAPAEAPIPETDAPVVPAAPVVPPAAVVPAAPVVPPAAVVPAPAAGKTTIGAAVASLCPGIQEALGGLTALNTLIELTKDVEILAPPADQDLIVAAPTDAAFATLLAQVGTDAADLVADTELVASVLAVHLGFAAPVAESANTIGGETMTFSVNGAAESVESFTAAVQAKETGVIAIQKSKAITNAAVVCPKQTAFVVDSVLLPADLVTDAPAPADLVTDAPAPAVVTDAPAPAPSSAIKATVGAAVMAVAGVALFV